MVSIPCAPLLRKPAAIDRPNLLPNSCLMKSPWSDSREITLGQPGAQLSVAGRVPAEGLNAYPICGLCPHFGQEWHPRLGGSFLENLH